MSDEHTLPVTTLKPSIANPAGVIKGVLMLGVVVLAGLGAFAPYLGMEEPYYQYMFFGMAALDFILAVTVPRMIEKQLDSIEYELYEDRLRVKFGRKMDYEVPYEIIEDVETVQNDRQRAKGVCNVNITTTESLELAGDPTGLTRFVLFSLPTTDAPADRIRDLVEDWRRMREEEENVHIKRGDFDIDFESEY